MASPTGPDEVHERERLAALRSYAVLDTPPEQAFDELTEMAARICEAPIALITLVDERRQWFKSELGLGLEQTERSISFCAHAIEQSGLFVVPDASKDPRFADNPLVTQAPHIRFYAGSPLVCEAGHALGTLCVIDHEPRNLKDEHKQALRVLSRHVMTLLESRRRKRELDAFHAKLRTVEKLREDDQRLRSEIAEHLRVEEGLRRERNLSEQIINSLPGTFYLFDEQGGFLRWNRNLETATGYSSDEMRGMHPLQFFRGEDKDTIARHIARVFESGQTEVEAGLVSKDGTATPHVFTGSRIVYDGQPCLIGMGIDVSVRKRLEEELRQAQKLESIGQLAAGIAHDFNNLLTVQHGYLSMLADDQDLPAAHREPVRQVMLAVEQASALTRQLLMFSRRQVMQFHKLDLNGVVRNLVQMLERFLGPDVRLQLDLAAGPLEIEADQGMIGQVILNLAVNGRDAMPEGGRLRIATSAVEIDEAAAAEHSEARPGRFNCLEVADSGVGMPHDVVARAFDPFFTTKDIGKGTGLGLSTVHGIVKQHQGWIELSTKEMAGTSFRIYLPAAGGKESYLTGEATAHRGARDRTTVLLVDDEPQVREMVRMALERRGYVVLIGRNGTDALRVWRNHAARIDLLLTDVTMPGPMNGLELARRLREERSGLSVIVSSGYSSAMEGRTDCDAESMVFLRKPFSLSELDEALLRARGEL
jgi:two-component system, cell cycle sensor histidine kinase and response regulator CckA